MIYPTADSCESIQKTDSLGEIVTYLGVNGKSIALLGWWVPALAIAVGSGIGEKPAIAQLIPDDTLGSESSIVTPLDGLVDRIDGGAIRGSNLFHSFGEFNIDVGREAFFDNPAAIENILTRVTGGNPSEIFGTLGVLGNANLFLVNPNGIVFGPDARLDVGGSFFSSTAGGILFRDGYEFSATNPDAPPLLTVNVPIGLQFGANPGGILNQSVATNDAGEVRGLSVPSGATLALVGGNVTLDGGSVQPRGGRVELGGLASVGTVGVNADSSLSFPEGVERADVSLSNEAEVNVRAGGGGEIAIHARNFQMSDLSKLRGGIDDGMGAPEAQAGDININATGTVALFDGSFVSNAVRGTATGNGGDVNVTSQTLSLTGNAELFSELNTLNEGQGSAGRVTVRTADAIRLDGGAIASDIQGGIGNVGGVDIEAGSLEMVNASEITSTISGSGNSGLVKIQVADSITVDASNIFNGTFEGGVGEAEDIEITSGSLLLSNGAAISSSSGGIGNSGAIAIQVRDFISLDFSDILSQVVTNGVGNAGEIDITTGSLFLTNGSQVGSGTFGRGDAGNILIRASDTVSIDGSVMSPDGTVFFSGITGSVAQGAIGNGGNVEITANSVLLSNGGFIGSSTSGQGDGGTVSIVADTVRLDSRSNLENQVAATGIGNSGGIEIVAGSVFLNDDSFLASTTLGRGNAGKIEIRATDTVTVHNSSIFSRVREDAVGDAGEIDITTGSFLLSNGGLIDAATFGEGNAGNIVISAIDTVSADGSVIIPDGTVFFSQILSSVGEDAIGNSGSIEISADSVSLSNGAFLSASTSGRGDAGNISINAQTVTLNNGSDIQSQVFDTGIGNSSGIDITTGSLFLNNTGTNSTLLASSTLGQGNSGRIEIRAADTVVLEAIDVDPMSITDSSSILVQVGEDAVGNSQGIEITTGSLILRNALLTSATLGRGDAGKIAIQADAIVSENSGISSNINLGAVGNSQGIDITTGSLSFSNSRGIGTFTAGEGNAGNFSIQATESISLDNTVISTGVASTDIEDDGDTIVGMGEGGDILITARTLTLNNSVLESTTDGRGDAGNILLRVTDFVSVSSLGIATNVSEQGIGEGGEIDIETRELSLRDGALVLATTNGQGDAGQIRIRASDSVNLDRRSFISTSAFSNAMGNAREIDITTDRLFMTDGSRIETTSDGRGDAGQIEVQATDSITLDSSSSITTSTFSNAEGDAGDIELKTDLLSLLDSAFISTNIQGQGDAGQVNIQASDTVTLDDSRISSSGLSGAVGNAEGIEITTDRLSLSNGSLIDALTNGRGDAGRVNIQASDTVTLDDSRISSSGLSGAVGNAEGIEITTSRLSLSNGSLIDAFNNNDNGNAGAIEVHANRIRLDASLIDTFTQGGEGDIILNSQELVLRNRSRIRTEAFGDRRGGNITINSDVIAALNNSDINANARDGQGGNISITAQGIFGTEFRSGVLSTPESDITATGATRLQDGSVQVNVEVDPTSGLVSLPETPVDAASLLGTDFCSQRRGSEFIYTGRGGIPPEPSDPASPTTVWQDWSLTEIPETPTTAATPVETRLEGDRLVEAQGWYVNESGQVVLTANPITTTPHQSGRVPIECRSLLPHGEP